MSEPSPGANEPWRMFNISRAQQLRQARLGGWLLLFFGVVIGFLFGVLVLLNDGPVAGAVCLFVLGTLCGAALPWATRGVARNWKTGT